MFDFWTDRDIRTTRKPHQCCACCHSIPSGSPAVYGAGKYDGEFYSQYMHKDCAAASAEWCRFHRIYDEWPGLREEIAANSLRREEVEQTIGDWPEVVGRLFTEPELTTARTPPIVAP